MDRGIWRSVITGSPLNLAIIYLILGGLWIVLSDLAVIASINDPHTLNLVQTGKGWVFVLGSSLLLYGLAYVGQQHLEQTNDELDRAVRQTSIFHRILRHNLRNQCNIILGHIHLLEDHIDDDPSDSLHIIESETKQLANMSQKAGLIADVVDDETDPDVIDVADIVHSTATTLQTYDSTNEDILTVDVSDTVEAVADPRLSVAIEELLENAFVHGETDDGSIHVEVSKNGDTVNITISDHGSGIPDIERDAINGDIETPLTHSEGLGLWLAKIIVAESAGDFTIDRNECGGTTATITLSSSEAEQQSRIPLSPAGTIPFL